MKKCFATMLVIMMMLSLVSCGQKPEETPAPQTTPAVSEPVASTTAPEIPAWKPTKTITLICPFNAGSTGDAFSRPFAEIMSKIAGVNVVVENMGGGSGSVGTNYMLSQPADGYTFSYHSNTGALTTAAGTAPFGVDDVLPLVNICSDYHVLSVLKDSPYKTLDDLVQAELDNPGSVRFGGAQVMGNNHLFALNMFRDAGFTAANYIPYDDGGSSALGLLGKNIDCLFSTASTVVGYIDSRDMRVLAYTLSDRIEAQGDAPTFAEEGFEHLNGYISFKGMFINPDCPQKVLDWYKDVTAQVCESKEWKEFIAKQGQIDTFMASDEFNAFYDDYVANATELFAAAT